MFRNVLLYFLRHKKLELNQKHNDHCGISQESDNQKCPKKIRKTLSYQMAIIIGLLAEGYMVYGTY
jgi:hypothetical protein